MCAHLSLKLERAKSRTRCMYTCTLQVRICDEREASLCGSSALHEKGGGSAPRYWLKAMGRTTWPTGSPREGPLTDRAARRRANRPRGEHERGRERGARRARRPIARGAPAARASRARARLLPQREAPRARRRGGARCARRRARRDRAVRGGARQVRHATHATRTRPLRRTRVLLSALVRR